MKTKVEGTLGFRKLFITMYSLKPFGRGGAVKLWEEKDRSINQSVTEVFVEQPLSLPGSAKKNLDKKRKI